MIAVDATTAFVTEARSKIESFLIAFFFGYREAFPQQSWSTIFPFFATSPTAPAKAPPSQAVFTPIHAASNFLGSIPTSRGEAEVSVLTFFVDLGLFKFYIAI